MLTSVLSPTKSTDQSTSNLSPKHQTSDISLKISDLKLKHQKCQRWSQQSLIQYTSDASLFCKNKPNIRNLIEKQVQHPLAEKLNKTKNQQEI